ncbi:MAG: SRPBCC family protein [Spirochaetota bacterium]
MKKVLATIAGILVILLLIPLFLRSEYTVEREVIIGKPKEEVFTYIKSLKNQDNYSVWAKKDPNMKKEFQGTDGTVGFISSWNSKKEDVGVGEQEIKKIVEGERLELELRFKEPYEDTSQAYMSTETVGEAATKVKWGFVGKMPYPMNAMLLFMNLEEMIGKDFSQGLENLKQILEKG